MHASCSAGLTVPRRLQEQLRAGVRQDAQPPLCPAALKKAAAWRRHRLRTQPQPSGRRGERLDACPTSYHNRSRACGLTLTRPEQPRQRREWQNPGGAPCVSRRGALQSAAVVPSVRPARLPGLPHLIVMRCTTHTTACLAVLRRVLFSSGAGCACAPCRMPIPMAAGAAAVGRPMDVNVKQPACAVCGAPATAQCATAVACTTEHRHTYYLRHVVSGFASSFELVIRLNEVLTGTDSCMVLG